MQLVYDVELDRLVVKELEYKGGTSNMSFSFLEVVFKTNSGYASRLLRTKSSLTNQQVQSFYSKFCKFNNCRVEAVKDATNNNLQVDIYMSDCNYYESKALIYAEEYGIISYKVKDNIMIYNQNYSEDEFIRGKWTSKPCTYQRLLNLDSGNTDTRKLQRLQKDGWDNV